MQEYVIDYKEISTAYFVVEADSEEEALARFEQWKSNEDNVYITISNTDNIYSDTSITYDVSPNSIDDSDCLTDEHWQEM